MDSDLLLSHMEDSATTHDAEVSCAHGTRLKLDDVFRSGENTSSASGRNQVQLALTTDL